MKPFKSILEFQKHFDTNDKCRAYLELQIWNGKPVCPYCSSDKAYKLNKGVRYVCANKECKRTFAVTVGTVFENTKIPLTKWFLAMYILSVHSKGISSLQLATWLDVQQRTAWFLNHRIRVMLTDKTEEKLDGTIEVDETYLAGKPANLHARKRKERKEAGYPKAMVAGYLQRNDGVLPKKVRAKVITDTTSVRLVYGIIDNVKLGANMVSDTHPAYKALPGIYNHQTVNHERGEYVRGEVHTQNLECFWNILKKQIGGIHHFVSHKHLQRYCNEAGFRYNHKELTQDERFADALSNAGGRLKYHDLIA